MSADSRSEGQAGLLGEFAFAPDAVRGAALDQAVRAGLADSLETIFDSLDTSGVDHDGRSSALLRSIRGGPVAPALFGVYVDLVLALFAERDAEPVLAELWGLRPAAADGLEIVTLDDRDLGSGQSARYRRLLREDLACEIGPLRRDVRLNAAAHLTRALGLLREGVPDLFGEFAALVRQIVLVTPGRGPAGFVFAGASTFSLWGALVLNVEGLGERLEGAVSLAHEAAHGLLFGLALGGRLTENEDTERYQSPLRSDLRPMEGVAHATYVTARMIYAIRALLGSGCLDAGEAARARPQLARYEAALEKGLATVLAHARFTTSGAAAFDGLRAYVDGRRQASLRPC